MKASPTPPSAGPRLVKIIARFVGQVSRKPVGGLGVEVRLYDKDPIHDDFICAWPVDAEGVTQIFFDLAECDSLDSPGEQEPDLYFELRQSGAFLVRTPVQKDLQFLDTDPDTRALRPRTIDLGTFEVPGR